MTFAFVNAGQGDCSLIGYPRLQMLDAAGHRIATFTRRAATGRRITTVTIEPGQRAYFSVRYPDGQEYHGEPGYKPCPTSAQLRLTLPGQAQHLAVRGKEAAINPYGRTPGTCGAVWISPVVASPP